MSNSGTRGRRRVGPSSAATFLLPALLLAAAARAEGADPRGLVVLQLSAGGGAVGMPNLMLGLGVGLVDTGTIRLDALGRLGAVGEVEARGTARDGTPYTGDIGAEATLLDLAVTRRIGRGELFAGIGYARARAHRSYEVPCSWIDEALFPSSCSDGMKVVIDDGTVVHALTGSAGARWALGSSVLLDLEARYQIEGASRISEGLSRTLGGFSVTFGIVYRTGFIAAWKGPIAEPVESARVPPAAPVAVPEVVPDAPPPPWDN